MTLHCVSIDPGGDSSDLLEQTISSDDAVLLLGRAADLAPYRKGILSTWIARGVHVYILPNTLANADSLDPSSVNPIDVNVTDLCVIDLCEIDPCEIDYAGWVKLSEQHASQRLWR